MNNNPRVLGVAATTRAYGLVVLEGPEILYYWSESYDKTRSPVQNLVVIRKKLVSTVGYLRPNRIGCARPKNSRVADQILPACIHAEVRWISRKRQARFRSVDIQRLLHAVKRSRLRPMTRKPDAYARAEAESFRALLKRKLPRCSKQALLLAFETARQVQKPTAQVR